MRSSRESRPTWMPGLNLLMYIERGPNDSTSRVTAVPNPAMIEAISITVTTPIITPITVRNERSLLPRRVARAIHKFSKISLRKSFIGRLALRTLRIADYKFQIQNTKYQIADRRSQIADRRSQI